MLSRHTLTREEALLVSIVYKDPDTHTHTYSEIEAVIALRVITASQQHVFPLTVLCGRLELNCFPPVSCGSLLSQSALFPLFLLLLFLELSSS